MLQKFVRALVGDPHKKEVNRLTPMVEAVNALEPQFEALSDAALRAKTDEFRARLQNGETLDDLLPEAFAAVREASKRTIGLRHYDVQLIGGHTLHTRKIAEMRTGEGKTLVATLPLYLNALTGRGVHLVTVNDYLARRDARWMAPVYQALGLTVGVLQMASRTENGRNAFVVDLSKRSPHEDQDQLRMELRVEAYKTNITYGTNSEFGFDYLRDNLTSRLDERVQQGHYFAIVDEVDNILIDEARTPLIISGPAAEETDEFARMALVVKQLQPEDYEVNEKDRIVNLTEVGETHVETLLGATLRDPDRPEDITPEQARLLGFLEQSLRAQFLYRRNKDYLVQAGKVVIVDEFTGRLMPGRRWSEGLHQAVEAKENVKIEPENVTYATITIQNYFRMYDKLAGMTGTALTEAEEFYKIYKLDVLPIPTNLEYSADKANAPLVEVESKDTQGYKINFYSRRDDTARKPVFWRRQDYPDVVFRSEEAKLRAITTEILHYHVMGRPMLVGTTSVEHSERLSLRLDARPLSRLAQVLLVRDAYLEQHNLKNRALEQTVPDLVPFNKSITELEPTELRQMAKTLNMTINVDEEPNLSTLVTLLELSPEDKPRLLKILQGGVPHQVLNARKHDEESQIIARAGAFGSVTIATNMAGRGVDIKLGGDMPEDILADVIRVLDRTGAPDPYDMTNEQRRQALLRLTTEDYGIYEEAVKSFLQYMDEMQRVRELGGLHVIGSERHEARRIDNQLRGRAARQGDPGSSRFYLSLEDDLMRLFGGSQADGLFQRLNIDESLPIESGILGRLVEQSQNRVEGANFDVRKHLLEYDDVLNSQRKRIYSQRDLVFTKEDLSEDVEEMLQTELAVRIPQAFKDPEGPWKLLAYLADIQPAVDFESVVFPSYPERMLIDEVRAVMPNEGKSTPRLRKALLAVAERALQAENEHILRTIHTLLEKTEETFEEQRLERVEIIDNFLEGWQDRLSGDEGGAPRRPQDLLDELTGLVGVPLKLGYDQMRGLPANRTTVADIMHQQVESALLDVTFLRLVGAVERRVEESLNLKPAQYAGHNYSEFGNLLMQTLETTLDRRLGRLLGDQGQIAKDLEPVLDRLQEAGLEDNSLVKLLGVAAQGSRMMFDRRTHRQGWAVYTRLNYSFMVAQLIEGAEPQQFTQDVLEHLQQARRALEEAWGLIEWKRLSQTEVVLGQLEETLQNQMSEALSEERYPALSVRPLLEFEPEDRTAVCQILGRRYQNHIYRSLLLSVISEQWVEYLTEVEALRVSIGLEAYAQRDPLTQYKGKATDLFGQLLSNIRAAVITRMYTFAPRRSSEASIERDRPVESAADAEEGQSDAQSGSNEAHKRKRRRR